MAARFLEGLGMICGSRGGDGSPHARGHGEGGVDGDGRFANRPYGMGCKIGVNCGGGEVRGTRLRGEEARRQQDSSAPLRMTYSRCTRRYAMCLGRGRTRGRPYGERKVVSWAEGVGLGGPGDEEGAHGFGAFQGKLAASLFQMVFYGGAQEAVFFASLGQEEHSPSLLPRFVGGLEAVEFGGWQVFGRWVRCPFRPGVPRVGGRRAGGDAFRRERRAIGGMSDAGEDPRRGRRGRVRGRGRLVSR